MCIFKDVLACHFPTQNLLSDAKMLEDVLEGFFGCDGAAGNVAELLDAEA